MVRIFFFFGQCTKISLKFTDKEPFLEHLSVIKTHFTDKLVFSGDLSVNDNDFAKCSAAHHLLNHCTCPRLRAKR